MRIEQLTFVCEVARVKSMSVAANNFFVTPQYISKAIKMLEEELGIILFRREKTGVFLTIEGEQFYEKAQNVLKEWSCLENSFSEEKIERIREPEGRYVGYLCNDSTNIFQGMLTTILRQYPNMQLECYTDDAIAIASKVQSNVIQPDFFCVTMEKGALILGECLKERYDMYTIYEDAICVLAGKDSEFATEKNIKKGVTYRSLSNIPVALYMNDQYTYNTAAQLLARHNVHLMKKLVSNDMGSIVDAVKHGECIFFCCASHAKTLLDEDLTIMPLYDKAMLVYRVLIRKDRANDPFFELLLQQLQNTYSDFRKIK